MSYKMRDRIAEVVHEKKLVHEPIAIARMILQEMRVPTPEMVDAATTGRDSEGFGITRGDAEDVWRAMIECALRDRRPEALGN